MKDCRLFQCEKKESMCVWDFACNHKLTPQSAHQWSLDEIRWSRK